MRDKKFQIKTKLVLLNFLKQTPRGPHGLKSTYSYMESDTVDSANIAPTQDDKYKSQEKTTAYSVNCAHKCTSYTDLALDSTDSHRTCDVNQERFEMEIQHKMENLQSENKDLETIMPRIRETATSLRIIADEFAEDYERRIESSTNQLARHLTYDNFRRGIENFGGSAPERAGLNMISSVMSFSYHCVHHFCNQSAEGIDRIIDFTTKYLEDVAADYIIKNGGWENISSQG